MASNINRQWKLAQRPEGKPSGENFELVEGPVPEPGPDEVLVKTLYLSVDPYMRGRMRDSGSYMSMSSGYADPWPVDEVMSAGVVGEIVESNHPDFDEGDVATGSLDWAEYSTAKGAELTPVDPSLAPVSTALGVLGMPARTAYYGLLDVGEPEPGDTVAVSGAAGAVGSVVCQIAKMTDCRVVGTAGSEKKIEFIEDELGVDVGINYKTTDDMATAMDEACPDGIDVYFDNVGGEVLDAVIPVLNHYARIPLCGQIALYNEEGIPRGPRNEWKLVEKEVKMEGFLHGTYEPHHEDVNERLAKWIDDGKLTYRESIVEGIENAPEAFRGLFEGENIGKQLVEVAPYEA